MNEIKVGHSGITIAAPLRVLLGNETGNDEWGKPFGNCSLFAVMPDRNQPFIDFELHYYGGMGNKVDGGNIQFVNGIVQFSAKELIQVINQKNQKLSEMMSQFLASVAVSVQKQILCEMNNADFMTHAEHELYSSWIHVFAHTNCLLEQSDEMASEDDPNYIHGSQFISEVAYKLTASILMPLFKVDNHSDHAANIGLFTE